MNKSEKENLREIFSRKTMYGDLHCTIMININNKETFGDDESHTVEFDVWDGFAYCYDYKGKEYKMTYPTIAFINSADNMKKRIREERNLNDDDKISIVNILETYAQLSPAY